MMATLIIIGLSIIPLLAMIRSLSSINSMHKNQASSKNDLTSLSILFAGTYVNNGKEGHWTLVLHPLSFFVKRVVFCMILVRSSNEEDGFWF